MPANIPYDDGFQVSGPVTPGPLGRSLKTWWNFEDFPGGLLAASGISQGIYTPAFAGTGAYVYDGASTALRLGILIFETGTTTTGYATIYVGRNTQSSFLFGAGVYTFETDLWIPALSTAAEEYILKLGFGDSIVGADFVDGAYFEYDRLANVNWQRCSASNSIRTKTDTTVVAVAGAWVRLKIVVNADGTSVEYFINGTSVGANTTNIPTGVGRETATVFNIVKSAGTTSRGFWVDWAWLHVDLTTSR